jgi:hypothetical protein
MSEQKWQISEPMIKSAIETYHALVEIQKKSAEEAHEQAWKVFMQALAKALAQSKFPQTIPSTGLSSAQISAARSQLTAAGLIVTDDRYVDGPLPYHEGFIIDMPPKK